MSRFDARTDNHYHFMCEKCGQVFDVDLAVSKELNGRVAQKTGFKVSHYRLEFHGLCRECQGSADKARKQLVNDGRIAR